MKKFISVFLVLLVMVATAATAFADSKDFSFTVQRGGSSVATAQVKKTDTSAAWISGLSSSNISSANKCSFRVRKSVNDVSASALYNQSSTVSFNIYYLSGMAVKGIYYKLWSSAPSTNSQGSVEISGTFAP